MSHPERCGKCLSTCAAVADVCAEIERRVTEALIQDDRIKSVSDFEFDISKRHEVVCTFVVHTIFGDVESEKGVTY